MKYKLAPTKQFMKMLKAQPPGLEKQLKKTLKHLQENPAHPSLRSKKYQSIEGVWESSLNMKYRVIIERDEDGFYIAEATNLPGCISQGSTRAEAIENIKEAIEVYLESLAEHGEPIPPPISEEIIEVSL